MKLREDNVFTSVCLFTGVDVYPWSHVPFGGGYTRERGGGYTRGLEYWDGYTRGGGIPGIGHRWVYWGGYIGGVGIPGPMSLLWLGIAGSGGYSRGVVGIQGWWVYQEVAILWGSADIPALGYAREGTGVFITGSGYTGVCIPGDRYTVHGRYTPWEGTSPPLEGTSPRRYTPAPGRYTPVADV